VAFNAESFAFNLPEHLLEIYVVHFDLSVAVLADGACGAVLREVALPVDNAVVYQICLSLLLLDECEEQVFYVLHELHFESIDGAAVEAEGFAHVVDEVRHLYAHLLPKASAYNPKLDDGTCHGRVIVMYPLQLLLFGLVVLVLRLLKLVLVVGQIHVSVHLRILSVCRHIRFHVTHDLLELT
jgi:hypothetical protein